MLAILLLILVFGLFWMQFPNFPAYVARPFTSLIAKTWTPETSNVRIETINRLKELYVDENVPAETGLLIAAKEYGVTEEEILAHIKAIDAPDAMNILVGSNRSRVKAILRVLTRARRQNGRE